MSKANLISEQHTDLSGRVTFKNELNRKHFISKITTLPFIHSYDLPEFTKEYLINKDRHFPERYGFSITLEIDSIIVEVYMILSLSQDNKDIKSIRIHSRVEKVVNISLLNNLLFSGISSSAQGGFDYSLSYGGAYYSGEPR